MKKNAENVPAWVLLYDAAKRVGDKHFRIFDRRERNARYYALSVQLQAQERAIVPEEHLPGILEMLSKAARRLGYWPDEMYNFVIRHGGEQVIQTFLDRNKKWVRIPDEQRADHLPAICSQKVYGVLVERREGLERVVTALQEHHEARMDANPGVPIVGPVADMAGMPVVAEMHAG